MRRAGKNLVHETNTRIAQVVDRERPRSGKNSPADCF